MLGYRHDFVVYEQAATVRLIDFLSRQHRPTGIREFSILSNRGLSSAANKHTRKKLSFYANLAHWHIAEPCNRTALQCSGCMAVLQGIFGITEEHNIASQGKMVAIDTCFQQSFAISDLCFDLFSFVD